MNQEKAREFFSSYYEGTLEPGIQLTVDQALKRDAALREEYRQFERTYEELGKLKYEVVEIPFDLHERIAAHVDKNLWELKRQRQPTWTVWARNLAFAGVGAAALIGAVLSLRPGTAEVVGAGAVTTGKREDVTISMAGGVPTIELAASEARTVEVREGSRGPVRRRLQVQGEPLQTPLRNAGAEAVVFAVTVQEASATTLVAVPGSEPFIEKSGSGDLEQFASALAGFYRRTVAVRVSQPSAQVSWTFEALDPVTAASDALDSQQYSVEIRDAVVWIMDH